jgi:FkbM family methyltransferase
MSELIRQVSLVPSRAASPRQTEDAKVSRRFAALLKRHPPLMNGAAEILRLSTRTYIRNAPWMFGKRRAYELYAQYLGGRHYRAKARTLDGDIMELATGDFVPFTIYLTGYWEPIITQYIRRHLKPGDTFVDCGANVGYYSLLASRIVGPKGNVFSIEASGQIFRSMLTNLELNHCANVTPIHAAAAGGEGESSIFLAHQANLGGSTTVRSLADKWGMAFEKKIRADTLENLVGSSNLRNARMIKLDVEGAERTVLAPLFNSLDRFSTHTEWLVEVTPSYCEGGQADADAIFHAFRDAGYAAYHIPNSYDPGFILSPPPNPALVRLEQPPREQREMLMSRRSDVRF